MRQGQAHIAQRASDLQAALVPVLLAQ